MGDCHEKQDELVDSFDYLSKQSILINLIDLQFTLITTQFHEAVLFSDLCELIF